MSGVRNGRLKFLVLAGVVVFCVFLFYRQYSTQLDLDATRRRFDDLHKKNEKLTREWKGECRGLGET